MNTSSDSCMNSRTGCSSSFGCKSMYLVLEEGSEFISNCTETSETSEFDREYTNFEFNIPIWMRDVSSGVKSPKFMIPPKP